MRSIDTRPSCFVLTFLRLLFMVIFFGGGDVEMRALFLFAGTDELVRHCFELERDRRAAVHCECTEPQLQPASRYLGPD